MGTTTIMNIKGLTMFMAALKEGMHGVNDAISLVQDDPDYSTLPCYDEVVAFMDCADKNSVSAECMACDQIKEEEGEEAEYETCEAFQADWGPNGAKCTAEAIEEGTKCMKSCSTGTCGGDFETAVECVWRPSRKSVLGDCVDGTSLPELTPSLHYCVKS